MALLSLSRLKNLFARQKSQHSIERDPEEKPLPKQKLKVLSRPYISNNEYASEILTDSYRYYVDDPNPWTANGDDAFLTQIWQEPCTANAFDLRTGMAIPDAYYWRWGIRVRQEDDANVPEGVNKKAVERALDHLLSPKYFHFRGLHEIIQLAIYTGHEGLGYEMNYIDNGWKTMTSIYHVDNRRFVSMQPTAGGSKFCWHLRRPQGVENIQLEDEAGNWMINNLMLFVYRSYEFTKKHGLSVAGGIYWEFRDYLFSKKFRLSGLDQLMFPLAILTNNDKDATYLHGQHNQAKSPQEQAEEIADKIAKSGSGNIVTIPYPGWEAKLLDQEANKMTALLSIEKVTAENMQNRILGSASMTMSQTKTYGANKASSMVSYLLIKQDRKFHQHIFNSMILRTLFFANKAKFAELGITDWTQLPDIDFLADELDPAQEIESVKASQAAGWRVDKEEAERKLNMKLADRIESRGEKEENVLDEEGNDITRSDEGVSDAN